MKIKKWLALALVLAMVVTTMGLAGCGPKSNPTSSSSAEDKDQYLNLPIDEDITTFDSSKAKDTYSADIICETQEALTRDVIDNGVEKIVPGGAEKWETSPDGLTWTFHLRDFKWSDGQPVKAQDYEYAWKRLLDPKVASEYSYFLYVLKNGQQANAGKVPLDQVGVKATDDKTLVVTLENPTPYFEKITSFKSLVPMRKDIVDKYGDKYGTDISQLVYCGPFMMDSWTRGQKLVMKKNPTYWDASKVKLSKVTYDVVKEEAPRMQMLQAGQLDAGGARGEYTSKFEALAKQGLFTMVRKDVPSESYMFFNCQDKIFKNAKVRLAFSLAFDREDFLKVVYPGRMKPAYGWCSYAIYINNQEYRKVTPEPLKTAKAANPDPKALLIEGLKEAGANPDPSKLSVHYVSSGTDTFSRTFDEFFQQQWETKLGVKIKIDAVDDFAQYQTKVNNMDFQIGGMGWSADYNDPMTFFDMYITGSENNNGKWSNSQYDALIDQTRKTTDEAKRLSLFQQAENILVNTDCAIMPTFYRDTNTFVHSYVKGLQQPSFGPDWECIYAYTEGRK
jgi:oligopeptide transport system substrate-binding protein